MSETEKTIFFGKCDGDSWKKPARTRSSSCSSVVSEKSQHADLEYRARACSEIQTASLRWRNWTHNSQKLLSCANSMRNTSCCQCGFSSQRPAGVKCFGNISACNAHDAQSWVDITRSGLGYVTPGSKFTLCLQPLNERVAPTSSNDIRRPFSERQVSCPDWRQRDLNLPSQALPGFRSLDICQTPGQSSCVSQELSEMCHVTTPDCPDVEHLASTTPEHDIHPLSYINIAAFQIQATYTPPLPRKSSSHQSGLTTRSSSTNDINADHPHSDYPGCWSSLSSDESSTDETPQNNQSRPDTDEPTLSKMSNIFRQIVSEPCHTGRHRHTRHNVPFIRKHSIDSHLLSKRKFRYTTKARHATSKRTIKISRPGQVTAMFISGADTLGGLPDVDTHGRSGDHEANPDRGIHEFDSHRAPRRRSSCPVIFENEESDDSSSTTNKHESPERHVPLRSRTHSTSSSDDIGPDLWPHASQLLSKSSFFVGNCPHDGSDEPDSFDFNMEQNSASFQPLQARINAADRNSDAEIVDEESKSNSKRSSEQRAPIKSKEIVSSGSKVESNEKTSIRRIESRSKSRRRQRSKSRRRQRSKSRPAVEEKAIATSSKSRPSSEPETDEQKNPVRSGTRTNSNNSDSSLTEEENHHKSSTSSADESNS